MEMGASVSLTIYSGLMTVTLQLGLGGFSVLQ